MVSDARSRSPVPVSDILSFLYAMAARLAGTGGKGKCTRRWNEFGAARVLTIGGKPPPGI